MFAMVIMELDDAAGIAGDCQGRRPQQELREGAEKLDALLSDAEIVLAGAAAILPRIDEAVTIRTSIV